MDAVTGFVEPRPDLVIANPGGPDDPLGESVLDPAQPWLRVFEPRDLRLVIGRHQDPERELITAHARADGVPIHRRVAGGGAVVLAPGMVVVAIRLANTRFGTTLHFEAVNRVLAPAIAAVIGVTPLVRGLGDLALVGADGIERKIVGASLRQTSRLVIYLGAILVGDAAALMDRYLAQPSREPDYRVGRSHGAFCARLADHGATTARVIAAVQRHCLAGLGDQALK